MKRLVALLLASSCLVPVSTPARAEPISAAIGLTAFLSGTLGLGAVGATIGGAIVGVGIAAGVQVITSAIQGRQTTGESQAESASGTQLSVQYGAALARAAQMGPGATGGHHVYTNVSNSSPGATNDVLQCVFVIGDGQHGKLTRLRYNGKDCTLPPDAGPDGYVIPEFVVDDIHPKVVIRYFKGTYDQAADAQLIARANPAGRWTEAHRGRGVCYLSIDQIYHEELQLTGIPSVQIETEGLVLYDPRKDSTNGGSGPHRWGQPNTYEPSANPAIQEYNFRRGVLVNGQRLLGMQISPVNLILAMYVAAANINDEPVPLAAGGTEPRYRCSVNISDDRANSNVLDTLRNATAGFVLERGGQFGPIPGTAQIPITALAFSEADMVVGERSRFSKHRSRTDLVTSVHGRFCDPAAFWEAASFPAREDPADDAAIGEKIAKDLDLTQVFSSSQAQRIAESERRRSLQQGQGTCVLPAKWIGVQPGDWLPFNSEKHGAMTVLVTAHALDTARHLVTISYERIANSVYSWTTAGELYPPDVGTPAAAGALILEAQEMVATGVNIPGDGGLVTPGIHFAWDPIMDPSVDQIDFEVRKVGDTTLLPFTAEFPSSGTAVMSGHGIAAATHYEYRHKLFTSPLRDTPWTAWVPVMSGTQHIVPNALISIPGDVELASFEAGLRDYVGTQLSTSFAEVDRLEQLIASLAADQEAQNRLELIDQKNADVRIVSQISTLAGGGKTWRGTYSPTTRYNPDDMVMHAGMTYYTPQVVKGIAPPAPPWIEAMTVARISQEWRTFAGEDGAAAQTSDSIEARFGSATLPISLATVIANWSAFAGPDYAAAQSSDSIEARFGAPTLPKSVATISNEWTAFAGPAGATAATHQQLIAALDGSSVVIDGRATAAALVNGKLVGTWQVSIDANGYVSGIKAYNDGATSQFVVLADTFLVAKPGVGGAAPAPIFTVGSVAGGANKMVLRGDMIADGTITAPAIVAGAITSNKIAADSIVTSHLRADSATYNRGYTYSGSYVHPGVNVVGGNTINTLVNTQNFPIVAGKMVQIFANVYITMNPSGNNPDGSPGCFVQAFIYIDGNIHKTIADSGWRGGGAAFSVASDSFRVFPAVSPGNHSVSILIATHFPQSTGLNTTITVSEASLVFFEPRT